DTVQKGQDYIQEDLHRDQGEIKEASNHHEQAIGDHPINAQERPKEPPLSEPSLKRKASCNTFPEELETPNKSAKHIFEMPICPSQEIISVSPYSSKLTPDNQATSNSEVAIHSDKTSDSSPTPLSFNHVQVALQTYYEPYLKIQRVLGDTLSLESCYINLAIVEAPDQRQKDKEDLKAQAAAFHRMPSYEEISKTNMKAPITLEKLFNKRKLRDGREDVPNTILVQGRAGIGKTTLCKKLVHLYQSGLWSDCFDAVLWLPLRQLKAFKACDLEDLLCKKYFAHRPRQEKESLVTALVGRKDKVLFILDGLDEILTDTQTSEGIALEAFLKHLLRQKHVVITSRPSGVDISILPKLDLELETVGFSTQNVNDYLSNVLTPEDSRAVQDFIKRTPSIQSLVNIPVQLDVVCYSWNSLLSNEQSLTMTGLYQTMVTKLWCKDAERLQKAMLTLKQIKGLRPYQIDDLMAIEIEYLGYLAFKGMWNEHQIEFDESTLRDAIEELDQFREKANQGRLPFQLLDTLKETSFLHTADAELDTGKDDSQRAWYFLHLTFQEYFAATWIAQHLQIKNANSTGASPMMMTLGETTAFVQEHKYDPRYEIVWWMVAGLLEGNALKGFFDIIQGGLRDMLGGRHQQLLASCLKEARSRLHDTVVKRLEGELMLWLHFELALLNDSDNFCMLGSHSAFPEEILVRSLGQKNLKRKLIVSTLGNHSNLTLHPVQELVKALQDEDRDVRDSAAKALRAQSTLSESAIQALIGTLQHEDRSVRYDAANILGAQSTLSESTIQALIDALRDENLNVRDLAAKALRAQSTLSKSAIQSLIGALQDEDLTVRDSAAKALGAQLSLSESAIQALVGALQDEYSCVRNSAANALGTQSTLPESAIQAIIGAFEDENKDVRYLAANILGAQSTLSESTIQALIGASLSERIGVRLSATKILESKLKLSESAIQALIAALQDKDRNVRHLATKTLGTQLTLPESAIQALIGVLQDKDRIVGSSATKALCTQSTLSESAIQALIGALQDENKDVRYLAAKTLSTQSTLSESAIQALI
ncbi:hypothetical protein BGX26_005570, partial [Mortierella sp. AD094]